MTSQAARIARNSGVQLLGRGLAALLNLGTNALVARALGEAGYGEFSLAFVLVTMVGIITDVSVNDIAVRQVSRRRDEAVPLLTSLGLLKLGTTALGLGVAVGAAAVLGYPAYLQAIVALAATALIAQAAMTGAHVIFIADLRMEFASLALVAAALAQLALSGAVMAAAGGLGWFVGAAVGANLLGAGLSLALLQRYLHPQWTAPSLDLARRLGRSALPRAGANIFVLIFAGADMVFLSKLASGVDLGLYAATRRFSYLATLAPSVVVNSTYPLLSAHWHGDRGLMRPLFQKQWDYMALLALGLGLGVSLVAADLLSFVFGPTFAVAAPALALVMGQAALTFLTIPLDYTLIAMDGQRLSLGVAMVAAAFNLAGNAWLIPARGYLGAAMVALATEGLVLGLRLGLVARRLGYAPSLGILGRGTVAGLVPFALVWWLVIPWLARLGLFLGGYGGLLLALGAVKTRELAELRRALGPGDISVSSSPLSKTRLWREGGARLEDGGKQ